MDAWYRAPLILGAFLMVLLTVGPWPRAWGAGAGLHLPAKQVCHKNKQGKKVCATVTPTRTPARTPTRTPVPTATQTVAPEPTVTAFPPEASTVTAVPLATIPPTVIVRTTPVPTVSCPESEVACQFVMLRLINRSRQEANLPPLTLDLEQSNGTPDCVGSVGHSMAMAEAGALWHANDMFPAASFPTSICVHYTFAAENLALVASGDELKSLQQAHADMMARPHDATTCTAKPNDACTILDPRATAVGIGIYVDIHGSTWITEDFIGD